MIKSRRGTDTIPGESGRKGNNMKKRLRVTFNAPLTVLFSLACAAVTLLGYLTKDNLIIRWFATRAGAWDDPLQYLRLFTHVLGHTGKAHLVGNISLILLLGPAIEERYGWRNLLTVILFTALLTGIAHNLLFPGVYLLGASGIVFAFILLTSFMEFREGELPLTVILVALIYLGQQVWDGLTVKDNISNLTHIIGGLLGAVAGYLLNRKNTGKHEWR